MPFLLDKLCVLGLGLWRVPLPLRVEEIVMFKKILVIMLVGFILIPSADLLARRGSYGGYRMPTYKSFCSPVRVGGYTKRITGIYVYAHRRTSPDSSRFNNWSTKGNVNPSTGKKSSNSYR